MTRITQLKRPCPVCGGKRAQALYLNELAAVDGLDVSYRLSRCIRCGFHFASELPAESDYLRYYQTLSKYDAQPSVSALDRQRITAAVDVLEQAGLQRDAQILDLGCGFGAFLSALRDRGWRHLRGLDPAPQSGRQALEQFGLRGISQGVLSDAHQSADLASADVVCLLAVVEHLPELKRDLSELLARLKPGARLLIEVPALDLFETDAGEPYGELSLEHIQFFSVQSVRNLLSVLGARISQHHLLSLPSLHSGALFVLAEMQERVMPSDREDPGPMDRYLAGSAYRWRLALQRVPREPFVLYGAGSHSARLLPQLGQANAHQPVAVLDGNINLHGKPFGGLIVQPPGRLPFIPACPC
jgi:SAM-dependent methyltransferase